MSKSPGSPVGISDAIDLRSQLADYYLWEEPEQGVRIYLNPETVDCLLAEVLRGVKSFSAADGEVGGILLGRTELDGERMITLIEDFASVPCGYRNGPLYCLSEKDYPNFEAALARCSSDTRGLSVVGYYRSHNRADLCLSSDDLKLIQRYFPEQDRVFLLVKTLPSRACTAGFFFWEDGHIQTEFTYLEVPFGPIQSFPAAQPARPGGIRVDEGLTVKEEDSSQKLPTVEARELPESVRQNRRFWMVGGVAVTVAAVMVTIAGFYWQSGRSLGLEASTPAVRTLGLHIGRKADSLAVTWDRNSPEILTAQRAVLYIRDGSSQKTLDLDVSQLRTGVVSYAPSGDDLQFRLETYRGGMPNSVESVHLLMPAAPIGVSTNETAGSVRLTRGKETSAAKSSTRDKIVVAPVDGSSSSQAASESALSAIEKEQALIVRVSSSVSSPKPFRFMPPTHSAQSMNEVQLDPPPSIPVDTKISELIIKLPVVGAEAPPPPDNPTKPAVERRPLAQGEASVTPVLPASGTAGPSQPPRVTTFVGPQLIRQVNPAIPAQLRSIISHPDLHIDVAVTIDVTGKVSDAKLVSTSGPGVRLISNEVLQAARLFRFRPAQDNHRDVESQIVLAFHFTGGPTK